MQKGIIASDECHYKSDLEARAAPGAAVRSGDGTGRAVPSVAGRGPGQAAAAVAVAGGPKAAAAGGYAEADRSVPV